MESPKLYIPALTKYGFVAKITILVIDDDYDDDESDDEGDDYDDGIALF